MVFGKFQYFEHIDISGFCNDGNIQDLGCENIRQTGHISAQRSIPLHDNITQIASALASHPMVRLNENKVSVPGKVNPNRWTQFAGAGVWLPEYNVYLVVSRVVYTRPGVSWPTISFLRGQLFDENWNHLEKHTIEWYGTKMYFPMVFEIPAVWWEEGGFFGPEDPRIILDEGVQGAEPLIVFNMISDGAGSPRAMWIHKPFSSITTILTIRNEERRPVEKNWAPFFHNEPSAGKRTETNEYLHFVYSLRPLQVLRCMIRSGECDWVFRQEVPDALTELHGDTRGEMRGGTNFMPIPIDGHSDIQTYIGLPRTHLNFCNAGATYRPEITVLSGFQSKFHIAYASVATEFGHTLLDEDLLSNPCTKGNILIPSSIARWVYNSREDMMEVSFSIADENIHILRLYGVLSFIRSLPYYSRFLAFDNPHHDDASRNFRWSVVGNEVIACSVEAAANSSRADSILAEIGELSKALEQIRI
ncbi:hypothetical protein G4B11_000227 [Aspergillus flavus]|nr:hypothetical protein G4B11_000227 [Aspergillus flavus]